jgi:hypothetical protein
VPATAGKGGEKAGSKPPKGSAKPSGSRGG